MYIHEYQAKQILQRYGIAAPPGGVAASAEEAECVAARLAGPWAVKAQIHAGARGPAGGVKIVRARDEVKSIAELMLGNALATAQTGPRGQIVRRVYIEQGCDIAQAFYLALLIDTVDGIPILLASPESGAEGIEAIAVRHPDEVIRLDIDPAVGLSTNQAERLVVDIGLRNGAARTTVDYLLALYRTFIELDATLIEISPLVVTAQGEVLALDAKMSFDDNALFRHPDLEALRDDTDADPRELQARRQGFNYVRLGGKIGTLASGAGLALATLDAIVEVGGEPANFLDLPPMARQHQVAEAFKLLFAEPGLACVLINVFGGGIMRCDVIADGLIAAARETQRHLPIVCRLDGTNADIAIKTLRGSDLHPHVAADLGAAARQALVLATAPDHGHGSSLLGSVKKLFSKGPG